MENVLEVAINENIKKVSKLEREIEKVIGWMDELHNEKHGTQDMSDNLYNAYMSFLQLILDDVQIVKEKQKQLAKINKKYKEDKSNEEEKKQDLLLAKEIDNIVNNSIFSKTSTFKTLKTQVKEQQEQYRMFHELIDKLIEFGLDIKYDSKGDKYIVDKSKIRQFMREVFSALEEFDKDISSDIISLFENYNRYEMSGEKIPNELTSEFIEMNAGDILVDCKSEVFDFLQDLNKVKKDPRYSVGRGMPGAVKKRPWFERDWGAELISKRQGERYRLGEVASEKTTKSPVGKLFKSGINIDVDKRYIEALAREMAEYEKIRLNGTEGFDIPVLIQLQDKYKNLDMQPNLKKDTIKKELENIVEWWYNNARGNYRRPEAGRKIDKQYLAGLVSMFSLWLKQNIQTVEDFKKYETLQPAYKDTKKKEKTL